MIDEDSLRQALNEVASSFEISEGAAEKIFEAAIPAPAAITSTNMRRRFLPRSPKGRIGLVAALVVFLVGVVTLASETSGPGGAKNAALPRASQGAPAGRAESVAASTTSVPSAAGAASSGGTHYLKAASPPSSATSAPASKTKSEPAKVEANGSVSLRIDNGTVQSVLDKLTNLATTDGGYVSNTTAQFASGSPGSTSATIVLQIPEPSFATAVDQVQAYGHVTSVSTTSTDVTGQYVDLQAQIAALQASRQQYLTIMTKATTIGGILAVQEQLQTIESQIEQLQGQLQVLDGETTYGSLSVTLTAPGHETHKAPPPPPKHQGSALGSAWHHSWTGFVSGFEFVLKIAGPVLFILLLLGALWLLGRLGWRAARRRMI